MGTDRASPGHLVPADDDRGRIVPAHPFAAGSFGFSVMSNSCLWWGGCAWDSFAIPHLAPEARGALVATRCPNCDTPHAWVAGTETPPAGEQVAHFLTPVWRIRDDVVNACSHQQLFCSPECVSGRLDATGNQRGYVLDLATLWRLAEGWYAGRLSTGYRRRDPADAAAYFAGVGLHGPFWGLTS